jgi:hypothetical protein
METQIARANVPYTWQPVLLISRFKSIGIFTTRARFVEKKEYIKTKVCTTDDHKNAVVTGRAIRRNATQRDCGRGRPSWVDLIAHIHVAILGLAPPEHGEREGRSYAWRHARFHAGASRGGDWYVYELITSWLSLSRLGVRTRHRPGDNVVRRRASPMPLCKVYNRTGVVGERPRRSSLVCRLLREFWAVLKVRGPCVAGN